VAKEALIVEDGPCRNAMRNECDEIQVKPEVPEYASGWGCVTRWGLLDRRYTAMPR
jgi:hypothetical protein